MLPCACSRGNPQPRQLPSPRCPRPCPHPQLAPVPHSHITEFLNDFLKIEGLRPAVRKQLSAPITGLEGLYPRLELASGPGHTRHCDTGGRAEPLGRAIPTWSESIPPGPTTPKAHWAPSLTSPRCPGLPSPEPGHAHGWRHRSVPIRSGPRVVHVPRLPGRSPTARPPPLPGDSLSHLLPVTQPVTLTEVAVRTASAFAGQGARASSPVSLQLPEWPRPMLGTVRKSLPSEMAGHFVHTGRPYP